MFANGAAQLVEEGCCHSYIQLHGAWVTLVDLSDEILCLPVSVCYQFGCSGVWVVSGKWHEEHTVHWSICFCPGGGLRKPS